MGIIKAICISSEKGTAKHEVEQAEVIMQHGLKGDAHAGEGNRQVSLLSLQKIDEFRARGAEVQYGAFGENLVVDGIDFAELPVGTIFRSGEVQLEITQKGKECNTPCEIYHRMGDCIMPREGIFAKVLQGGIIKKGDRIDVE